MSTDHPNLWTGNMDLPTQRSNSILSVYSLNLLPLYAPVLILECYEHQNLPHLHRLFRD